MIVRLAFILLVLVSISCREEYSGYTEVGDLFYKLDSVAVFPAEIQECSGFTFDGTNLVVVNDGMHGPELHHFDPSTATSTAINIKDAYNNDWEAVMMTQDEIIVGDLGNNKGIRETLRLYHIDRLSYELVHITIFNYPEQTFEESTTHNFDAEAISLVNGEVCLFTKNRGNTKTNLYTGSLYSSEFVLRDSIEVPWRVTDSYYHEPTGNLLLLCNQKVEEVHMSAIKILSMDESFRYKNVETIPLPVNDKLEAITLKEDFTYYLGSESESGGWGMLYEIDIKGL